MMATLDLTGKTGASLRDSILLFVYFFLTPSCPARLNACLSPGWEILPLSSAPKFTEGLPVLEILFTEGLPVLEILCKD